MKIPVTFTTLLFLVNLILCGQSIHSVSGMIRDEMGKPLPGANIYFPELEVGAVSDADGHFMIRNLPNGKFVLNISFIGYETDIRTIFFSGGDQTLTIKMIPAKITGKEVVISGSGGVATPVIRGLSTSNILFLNNGIRLENYQFSQDHPYLVDESGLDQVEIIKGPASLLYGSDAIGGVINLVQDYTVEPNSLSGNVNLQYFSNTKGLSGTSTRD